MQSDELSDHEEGTRSEIYLEKADVEDDTDKVDDGDSLRTVLPHTDKDSQGQIQGGHWGQKTPFRNYIGEAERLLYWYRNALNALFLEFSIL